MIEALLRLSRGPKATVRDPRAALLNRLAEVADSTAAKKLEPLRRDADPVIAAQAAQIMTAKLLRSVTPLTTRYLPAPFPADTTLQALRGATARIRLRDLGTLEMELFTDDAPATVATFAALAQRGAFAGLTWHRIVPNFVVQGGSPGADEYDALTATFLRDEVGLVRHARGTFGISTRGRDTGDGQLFINLVDNMRLDHDYTVFGRITKGLDVMDRIQEGTVIDAITIRRATP
jgi:cyclophilin family peptidyl-prolyl cis-trans isomerase